MTEIDADPPRTGAAGLDDDRVYSAIVTNTPQGRTGVWVTIPALTDAQHGPCRLQPVPGQTPQPGDRCLVARANGRDDWWIVQFDDRDVTSDFGARLDALETPQPDFQMFLNATAAGAFPLAGTFAKVPFDTFQVVGGQPVSCPGASLLNDNFVVQDGQEGIWLFSGGFLTADALTVGGAFGLSLFVNGNEYKRLEGDRAQAAATATSNGSVQVRVAAGDTVHLAGFVVRSADTGAGAGAPYTYFHGCRISS